MSASDLWADETPAPAGPGVFGDGTPVPDLAPGEMGMAERVAREIERMLARRAAEAEIRAQGRPPVPPAETLAEFLTRGFPPVRFRIEDLWPAGGRILLVAQAKTGKTTLRDNLARSLIDGGRFLDRFTVHNHGQPVEIIDTELPPPTLQRWLYEQTIRHPELLRVRSLRGTIAALDLLDEDCRGHWVKTLRGVHTLIVDCIGPILATFGLDESKNTDVGRWLSAFDALLDDAGIAEAVLVHHMGHLGERSRGASRLADWPDATWKLVRAEPVRDQPLDPTRYFSAEGRDVAVGEGALRYDGFDRHLSIVDGNRREVQVENDLNALVDYLRDHVDQCRADLEAADLGFSRPRLRKAIARGLGGGLLAEVAAGRSRKNICLAGQVANPPQPADLFGELEP